MKVTTHVAPKRYSAIDGRTTRHEGYQTSQKICKRVEEMFGWMKTVGGIRKIKYRGEETIDCLFTLTAAAFNFVLMRNLGLLSTPP